MTEFTPWLSLGGGALIGLAAVILMAGNGRIAGVSGIVSRLLPPNPDKAGLNQGIAFVVGLLLATILYSAVTGGQAVQSITTSAPALAIAGVLVGFGAVLGNGCTSGHGVCGISRLSIRSVVATLTFMATAFMTVYIVRHVVGG
jgi:uncharacterized membrane protein YedE/YeeE